MSQKVSKQSLSMHYKYIAQGSDKLEEKSTAIAQKSSLKPKFSRPVEGDVLL